MSEERPEPAIATDVVKQPKGSGGIPLSEWSGSGATDRLHKTIQQFTETAEKQTRQLIWLTRWLVGLTIALLILTGYLVYEAVTRG